MVGHSSADSKTTNLPSRNRHHHPARYDPHVRGFVVALVAAAMLAGCDAAIIPGADNYPFPNERPSAHQYTPAAVGQPVHAIVLYLRPHLNDSIEFLDAVAIPTVTGADTRFYLARPVIKENGQTEFGQQLEPLIGAKLTRTSPSQGPETQYGIVLEVTPREARRFEITDLRFNYRLNDQPAETGNGMTTTFTVCGGETTCAQE
jgi:hypothetical protein